ncbi:MAG TPA: glycerol-3-phosphate dehydrogenase/oxidase, partial [Acidimicrobiales bacterium]
MPLGTFDRDDNLAALGTGTYDVLVIGGGITGAGVALDAASRGLRTALVERDDFASGTSSKSSKLVHGGLRYLQNGDVRLVYEALHERQRLLRNAPHLVRVLPFLIPVFTGKEGIIPKQVARALGSAMWMYDLTGGLRIGKVHRRLSGDAARRHMPTLGDRLAWAYLYYDAQTDDARLTLTVARTAALDHGATVVNHAPVTGLVKAGDRVTGALVDAGGTQVEVRARVLVNATGVWADDVRALDEDTHPHTIRPAKGIHITVPWHKVRNDIAAVVPVPGDRRSIFVVPWPGADGTIGGEGSVTYIGTTDTDYEGELDDPQCTADDVAYLIGAMNRSLSEPLDVADVVGTWAGLRPLVSDATSSRTADLSRRHRVTTSAGGLVTVTGGKLTTYREMAADAVDAAVAVIGHDLPRRIGRSRTKRLALRGAEGWADARDADARLAE